MKSTAVNVSKLMTCAGAVLIILCVGYFMLGWARDSRWLWLLFGVVLVLLNMFVLFNELRPRPKPRDWTDDEVREVISSVTGDAAQVRTLRRTDKGLTLQQAVSLVQRARNS